MATRSLARADGLTVLATVGTVLVGAAFASLLARGRPLDVYYGLFLFHNGPAAVVLLWMGRLVLQRRRGHGAGLVLLAIGVFSAVHTAIAAFADVQLVAAGFETAMTELMVDLAPADLPLTAAVPVWLMGWLWVPAPVLAITTLPLVFPDGEVPGRRWRAVVGIAAVGAGLLVVALAADAWPTATWVTGEEPAAIGVLLALGGVLVLVAAVAGFVALAQRWRSADVARRRQFRPVGIAAGLLALIALATYPWQWIWIPAVLVGFHGLLVAYALGVARYRLHDFEPVLGRAVVALTVSVLAAGVYAVVVVGVSAAAGRSIENRAAPVVAAAAVGLAIEPARRGARRLADRLVYRADADRREVLSRLAARASTSPTADVLGEVTTLLVRSTGAARAEVWLDGDGADGDGEGAGAAPLLAAAAGTTDDPVPVLRSEVLHQGERFGELRLHARAAADLVPDAPQVLADVARTLGVVLRNDQLTAQLRVQLDELRASRQRLVEVHDHTRRSMERDLHDGAQARLIALRLRLGALRAQIGDDGDAAVAAELEDLGREVDSTVRSLRDLARGLHPPVLDESGLLAALRAHGRGLPLPVVVAADADRRYPRAVEVAVYFSCLEAVQNAVRHSGGTEVSVLLEAGPDSLRFRVSDDGVGFDPSLVRRGAGLSNIADRIAALGGSVRIDATPGSGTRVCGHVRSQSLTEAR